MRPFLAMLLATVPVAALSLVDVGSMVRLWRLGTAEFFPQPPWTIVARVQASELGLVGGTTDGLAMLNSNDLRQQLGRIADDLTSYYLLGYYSTNPKLDGKYREIKVRVKRLSPGTWVTL